LTTPHVCASPVFQTTPRRSQTNSAHIMRTGPLTASSRLCDTRPEKGRKEEARSCKGTQNAYLGQALRSCLWISTVHVCSRATAPISVVQYEIAQSGRASGQVTLSLCISYPGCYFTCSTYSSMLTRCGLPCSVYCAAALTMYWTWSQLSLDYERSQSQTPRTPCGNMLLWKYIEGISRSALGRQQ
jgi:hypothetical protein